MQIEVDGGFIVTYSGEIIEPLNPNLDAINIEDIAHSLANQCRFTGHVRKFYSVAEHSVRVAKWILFTEKEELNFGNWTPMQGLLHDASEAYLADIARPVKQQPEIGVFYKAAEERLEKTIAEKFGYDFPYAPIVKRADQVLLRSEQRDLMPDRLRFPGEEYLDYTIYPWSPELAEAHFLTLYEELVS